MRSTKSLLISGAAWTGLSKILVNVIGLISTVILARLLMPEDFGIVAIAAAFAIIVATVTELSLAQALVQHEAPDEDHYHTAFTLNLLRGLLLAVIVGLLAWPTAQLYGDQRLVGIIIVLAIGTLFGGLVNPKLAVLERRLEFRQLMTLSLAEKLGGFVVSIAIAYFYQSYWALVLGQLASQIARSGASYLLIRYRPRFTLKHGRDLMSFSIWLTLGQAVQAINWRADPMILGLFVPNRVLGQFSMGGRVTNLAISDVLHPVTQLLFPAFAQIRHEPDRLRAAYIRAQGLLGMIGVPLGLGLAAVAEPLTLVLLGDQWRDAVIVIQLMAIAAVMPRLVSINAVAMAAGRTKALFHRDLRALAIRLPLILGGALIAPEVGLSVLTGALLGNIVSAIVNAVLNMQLVSSITLVTIGDQVRMMWRPIVAASAMAGIVLIALDHLPFDQTMFGMVARLATGGMIGGLAYAALIAGLWMMAGRPKGAESEAAELASAALAGARNRIALFRSA